MDHQWKWLLFWPDSPAYGTQESKNLWQYHFSNQKLPYPSNVQEFEKFSETFQQNDRNRSGYIRRNYTLLPLKDILYIFPFNFLSINHGRSGHFEDGRFIPREDNHFLDIALLEFLFYWKDEVEQKSSVEYYQDCLRTRIFGSLALLSLFVCEEYCDMPDTARKLRQLYHQYGDRKLDRDTIVKDIQQILPDRNIPHTVVDAGT